jgi:hypothetical protein
LESTKLTVETVPWGGWQNNLRLANEHIELIITLDVGPRILYMAPSGGASHAGSTDIAEATGSGQTTISIATGDNLFAVFTEQSGGTGESNFRIRGGHRFWIAPESDESDPFTYFPDNAPVAWELLGEGHVRLRPAEETANGFQKEIELRLHAGSSRLEIIHRVTNISTASRELAPWALSVMAPGGTAIVPQPPLGSHPADLLPNRSIILWPYTDLKDPRLHLGSGFITLQQDVTRGPIKIGLAHPGGWAAYARGGVLFVKHFSFAPDATYPDMGCNCELFTNEQMIEVESLGPLQTVAPGQIVEHHETWQLYTDLPGFDPTSESSITSALKGVMPSLGGTHH